MEFELSEDQTAIVNAVGQVVADFDDDYWLARDRDGAFPDAFHRAMADGGWLGIAMPEEVGGAGLGVTEAALMMMTVAGAGGAMAAASAIHMNIFGPHPIVVFGTDEQKKAWLAPLIRGEERTCFGVTEPNAGLDTGSIQTFAERTNAGYVVSGQKIWTSTAQSADKIMLLARTTPRDECKKSTDGLSLFYTDLDRAHVEVKEIEKMGRKAVDSNMVFIDALPVPRDHLIGEEGEGFRYILHGLNPERILVAAEALAIGRDALRRATTMPASAPSSAGRSARTRRSSIPWRKAGSIWRRLICSPCARRQPMTPAGPPARRPTRRNISPPRWASRRPTGRS